MASQVTSLIALFVALGPKLAFPFNGTKLRDRLVQMFSPTDLQLSA
jgi:hypothetical protein